MLQNLQNKLIQSKGGLNKVEADKHCLANNVEKSVLHGRLQKDILIRFTNLLAEKVRFEYAENDEVEIMQIQAYVFRKEDLYDLILEICDMDEKGLQILKNGVEVAKQYK